MQEETLVAEQLTHRLRYQCMKEKLHPTKIQVYDFQTFDSCT